MRNILIMLMVAAVPCPAIGDEDVSFERAEDHLKIRIDGQEIADYVFRDPQILRPYIRHLRTRSGTLVTRNHPPVSGKDLDDHPTMHPGLWLAFGDISGTDFWRNQGRVNHLHFVEEPRGESGRGTFTVRNSYEHEGQTICTEDCAIAISTRPEGYLIHWESTFRSAARDIVFGDQEEMGLGVRVATPLAVVNGGAIRDSEGREDESGVWGQQAEWCQYGGVLNGRRIGVVLMPDPENFRASWFHARDSGLLVANPFGRNAFTRAEKSEIKVKEGEELRFRFDLLVYEVASADDLDISAIYDHSKEREK